MKTSIISVRGKTPEQFAADPLFVYVGRRVQFTNWKTSPFGNPYRATEHHTPAQAVREFECDLINAIVDPSMYGLPKAFVTMAERLPELLGKRLGCWCGNWPDPSRPLLGEPGFCCHALILARLVDEIYGGTPG